MSEELIAKATIPIILSIAIRHLYSVLSERINGPAKLNEDYKFISSFLATSIEKREKLVVEHAFYTYFRYRYSYEAIELLMRFSSPMKAFRLFKQAGHYVTTENGKVVTTRNKSGLKIRMFVKVTIYFIFFFAALSPLVAAPFLLVEHGLFFFLQMVCLSVIIGAIGFDQLLDCTSIKASINLLKEQSKQGG